MMNRLREIGRFLRAFRAGPYRLPDGSCGHCRFTAWRDGHCMACYDGWR